MKGCQCKQVPQCSNPTVARGSWLSSCDCLLLHDEIIVPDPLDKHYGTVTYLGRNSRQLAKHLQACQPEVVLCSCALASTVAAAKRNTLLNCIAAATSCGVSMSVEASQQNFTQLGARESVHGRSGRGRGRSQGRGRGRGRGRGIGFSSRQHPAEPAQRSADHQSGQLPVGVSAHPATTGHEVHHGRPTPSRDANAGQEHSAGPVLQVQAARQQQTRQHPRGHSRQRQAGHRNVSSHIAVAAPAAAGQIQPIQDSSAITDSMQDLPDCVICCEPMQV